MSQKRGRWDKIHKEHVCLTGLKNDKETSAWLWLVRVNQRQNEESEVAGTLAFTQDKMCSVLNVLFSLAERALCLLTFGILVGIVIICKAREEHIFDGQ